MQTISTYPVGRLLREWRQRSRLSQLDLALEAGISPRHLSFLETGRSLPSREVLLRLAEQLKVTLREQNVLLVAAGYAPIFLKRPIDAPELQAARQAVDLVLASYEPAPALALDRHWTLVAANRAIPPLLTDVDPALLTPPVNMIRLSLHPSGLAPSILNYWEWRAHLLARLREQFAISADTVLGDLLEEVTAYTRPGEMKVRHQPPPSSSASIIVPLRLRTVAGPLAFISTTTVFGTSIDITLAELAIESFFPADTATATVLRRLIAEGERPPSRR